MLNLTADPLASTWAGVGRLGLTATHTRDGRIPPPRLMWFIPVPSLRALRDLRG
jgi:hypothetical protein